MDENKHSEPTYRGPGDEGHAQEDSLRESAAADWGMITVELPTSVYKDLELLALEEQSDPVRVITRLVTAARQQRAWRRDLDGLRRQIQKDGGLQVGSTQNEIVERLRQTRREIFEAEYAHLYRSSQDTNRSADNVLQDLLGLATDLGVGDLAEQHDHYLYGAEKR